MQASSRVRDSGDNDLSYFSHHNDCVGTSICQWVRAFRRSALRAAPLSKACQ